MAEQNRDVKEGWGDGGRIIPIPTTHSSSRRALPSEGSHLLPLVPPSEGWDHPGIPHARGGVG